MLLLIDNYDSFTYNLVQAFQVLGQEVKILRNNVLIQDIHLLQPQFIVIGPGPGNPEQAGISKKIISEFQGKIPLLGICLGHQAICEVYGGNVIQATQVMHGKLSRIFHQGKGLFQNLPNEFDVTRYHSLIADPKTLPECLEITAKTAQDEIMGVRHKQFAVEGLQFHPESVASEYGLDLLARFLN